MKWTEKETSDLIKLYSKLTNKELLTYFNRTRESISHKASRLEIYKTQKIEFKNRSMANNKGNLVNWENGNKIKGGYILTIGRLRSKGKRRSSYTGEHILVMENHLGRELKKGEIVHHLNNNRSDNGIENLELMTQSQHASLHNKERIWLKKSKDKLSEKCKERYKDETKHPRYIPIDIETLMEENKNGKSTKKICEENNISRSAYYDKKRKWLELTQLI